VQALGRDDERHAAVRDGVIVELREKAFQLARDGLRAGDIEQRLVKDSLTVPEREFCRTLALGAEASVRNLRVAEVLDSESLAGQLRTRGVHNTD
jgi:hypothetical protein